MKLGIDLGGTFVKFAAEDGRRWKVKTPKEREGLIELLSEKILKEGAKKVCIAVAGMVNKREGAVELSPNLRFLNGVKIREEVERRTKAEVKVLNDASAAALGEYREGAGRGSRVMVCLTLGTGLGGGAVVEGKLLEGFNGKAMEIGHTTVKVGGWKCHCGRRGCLEAYASSYGLERFYFILTGRCESSFSIIERAKGGEEEAKEAIKELSRFLTVGVVNAVHTFNPDRVVICGGIPESFPEIVGWVERGVKEEGLESLTGEVKVRKGELSEFSGAVGALYYLNR
ncbi:ROK family protein [Thermovibrio sp.]